MKSLYPYTVLLLSFLVFTSCRYSSQEKDNVQLSDDINLIETPSNITEPPTGMVWVPSKTFLQGAKETDPFAMPREKPAQQVTVDGFFIDAREVSNADFRKFVKSTDYITVAERPVDWEEMKKELPAGTTKPADSILQPGSLIFDKKVNAIVSMQNYGQWWKWKIGANWQHPEGPESSIEGKDDFPVVHIALEDAIAYCKWANRTLPTEAQWESAAQGSYRDAIYTWGNNPEALNGQANTWQGTFPTLNTPQDGFKYIATSASYPANTLGIYDLLGNAWEWTTDLYNENYYRSRTAQETLNPTGAKTAYSPNNPYQQEYIIKGGSYLCHESYCASFRISARMGMSPDSGSDHVGFRTVATPEMLEK